MKTGRAHHRACVGFSIIELLTAIAVGLILTAVAAPQLPVYWAQFQVGSAARQVAVSLQRARMKAVGENAFCRIAFISNTTYVLQSSADGSNFIDNGLPVSLPTGVVFSADLPLPTFNRLGTLASAGSVTLTHSMGYTRTLEINILGRIRIS